MLEAAALANFLRLHSIYPVVRLGGIGALVCCALSFGMVASSNPFLAIAKQAPSKQALSSPSLAPDYPPPQALAPGLDDQGLHTIIFRPSLIVDVPLPAAPVAVHLEGAPFRMKKPIIRKSISSASASGSVASVRVSNGRVRIGTLACRSVQTSPEFNCIVTLKHSGTKFRYVAAVRQMGSEFGVSQDVSLSWEVFGTFSTLPELAGTYNGVAARPANGTASPGALVGAGHNAITLLPRAGDGVAETIVSMQLAAR
jgi:hypothetical protein